MQRRKFVKSFVAGLAAFFTLPRFLQGSPIVPASTTKSEYVFSCYFRDAKGDYILYSQEVIVKE